MAFSDSLSRLNEKISGVKNDAALTVINAGKQSNSILRELDKVASLPDTLQETINSSVSIVNNNIGFANNILSKFSAFSLPTVPKIHDLSGLGDKLGEVATIITSKKSSNVGTPSISSADRESYRNIGVDALASAINKTPVRTKKRTSNSVIESVISQVSLPMPQDISITYPKNWEGANLGLVGAGINGVGAINVGKAGLRNLAGDNSIKKTIMHNNRIAEKEHIKLLFKDIPFRTFELSYKLFPKSAAQTQQIADFIQQMKVDSAPSADGLLWHYPNTMSVLVTSGSYVMIKSPECALTNISVNYTADGIWSQHKDGSPTAVVISLSYQELIFADKNALGGEIV